MLRSTYHRMPTLLLFCAALLFSACDIPTSGPDFAFTTGVRAPLIFDKTFVLMGPDDTGVEALVDTTDSAFDNIFTVNEADKTIFIVQELDGFSLGDFEGLIPDINLDPIDVAVQIGGLAAQRFSTSYSRTVGVFESAPASLPALPLAVENGRVYLPIPPEQRIIDPPSLELLDLSSSTFERVRLTQNTDGVNAFDFTLTNNLPTTLTDDTFDPANAPVLVLQRLDGTEIGRTRFDHAPGAGEQATARLNLADATLTPYVRVFLDLGTPSGFAPIEAASFAILLQMEVGALQYAQTTLSDVGPQQNIDISQPEINLSSDINFSGLVTKSGQSIITINNTLPVPVTLETLELTNMEAVAGFPAGFVFMRTSGQRIAANGSALIPVDLGQVGIAPRVTVTARASSAGSIQAINLEPQQGLTFEVNSDVDIDQLLFSPEAQEFQSSGAMTVDVDEVRFESDQDYVELKSGLLRIDDLVNQMDLGLERVDMSLPSFRFAPYRAQDSLVIRFEGSVDNPGAHRFSKIARKSVPRSLAIDLTDLRIYPRDNTMKYHISVLSEASETPSIIRASDEIRAAISVENAQVRRVAAVLQPFSVTVTDDADGDGRLDILNDDEAEITSFEGLEELSNQQIDGLELVGSSFTLTLRTNITPNVDLYAVLMGTTPTGETIYLSGRGDHAVAPGDTMAANFLQGGTPVQPEHMIRFAVQGAPSPDQPVSRTIVLNAQNSNVDAFISHLPDQIRYVGKAVVSGNGGTVELREPFTFEAALGASIPLNIGSDFTFAKVIDADLTSLGDLTDPGKEVQVDGATLRITYANGIPLGIDARLEVLNDLDEVQVVLPTDTQSSLRINPAPHGENGTATAPENGLIEIEVDEATLHQLSLGTRMRLNLMFVTDGETAARLRADDTIKFSLQGDFKLNVTVR